jgi:hypothetical protein
MRAQLAPSVRVRARVRVSRSPSSLPSLARSLSLTLTLSPSVQPSLSLSLSSCRWLSLLRTLSRAFFSLPLSVSPSFSPARSLSLSLTHTHTHRGGVLRHANWLLVRAQSDPDTHRRKGRETRRCQGTHSQKSTLYRDFVQSLFLMYS